MYLLCGFNKFEAIDKEEQSYLLKFMFKSLLRVYDGTGYLVLFSTEKYDGIYKKIRYLISIKKGAKNV